MNGIVTLRNSGRSETADSPQEEGVPKEEGSATLPDSPLLDLADAAVKQMIKGAKKRGYVTHDQLNAVLPSEKVSSDQIEDVYAMLNEMGINVVDPEEAEQDDENKPVEEADDDESDGELVPIAAKVPAKAEKSEPSERTDDPVRMYLREMGSLQLLSREGEIAIAKRIEAGREAMIAGLCESPLTFQAIIIWRDELNDGKVFLRDIIDLEATHAGPDAKGMQNPGAPGAGGTSGANGGTPPFAAAPPAAPRPPPRRRSRLSARRAQGPKARRARPARRSPRKASSMTTTWRTRSRSPRSRPSSSPRCWRRSTPSPPTTSGCAACRTRTSRSGSRAPRCRRARSASTRSSRKRSSPR